jgi:phenylacetate-CoA ligase
MRLLRLLPRFRAAYRELETLAARERWSRSAIEGWQLERLNAVWRHAIAHVPHYRRVARRLTLPDRFGSLGEYQAAVPVLSRAELKAEHRDFLSERPAPGGWHISSGSTGTPTRFYWGHEAHREVLRCRYRMQAAWGVDVLDRSVMLWGNGAAHETGMTGRLARVWQPVGDWLRNRLRLSAYHLAPDDLRAHLKRLAAFRPALLYAYSTAGYLLAREAQSTGWRCDSLKACFLSAEPAFPHIVAAVEKGLGVPAATEYGATECALIAGEGPDRSLRVREDVVFAETRSAGDGRQEIVLTVLNNPSYPLLRYAIGDMSAAPLEVPGQGFAVLKNVEGRVNQLLLSRAGRFLHPLRFDFLFGFSLADVVRRYSIHQDGDGAVTATVEVSRPVPDAEVVRVQRELDELLEGYPVTVRVVPAMPQAPRKHHWITSALISAAPAPVERDQETAERGQQQEQIC